MKRKRPKMNGKRAILLSSLLLVLTVTVGGTLAYIVATDGPLVNWFKPSVVSCEIEETFADNVKSNVTVKNTGDTTAYIRGAIVVTWMDAQGNVYAGRPEAKVNYTIDLNGTDWFLHSDGFYYYKKAVAAGESTTALINTCSPIEGQTPAGFGLRVDILASAIQSVPTRAVEELWPVTVGSDGSLTGKAVQP